LRIGGYGAAGAALIAGAVFLLPKVGAEGLRQGARRGIDRLADAPSDGEEHRRRIPEIRAALVRATRLDPHNGQAWADLSYALALGGRAEPARSAELGSEAERAADRALALATVCSEFWIRRGVARDMQGRWGEAGRDFSAAVAAAPADAFAWYYQAEHLSRIKSAREPAEAALEFCLRLDPGNPSGLALRQRLAIESKAP
jgi:tetratricopeptide (TPR) repeat protein